MTVAGVKRDAQRRRTRKAIVEAAARLLADGRTPSIAEVAEVADVSRRTVYMYFATLEHLLADAALEATRARIEPTVKLTGDPVHRVDALVRALTRDALEIEHLGRTIIRHTIEAAPREDGDGPRRGYRRVEWIELALEPIRGQVGPKSFERLVSALTLAIGWEAMIVLRDVRGLSAKEIEDVAAWTARSLVSAALAE